MIKLNIQRFNSTNKTTHYELSQYVSSDLPTYLVDYNSDMSKIDAGINTAQTTADTASTAATNAQTAAETAQSTANTAVTNAATAQSGVNTNATNIGTLANLTTVAKSDLVSAINEVDGKNFIETTTSQSTNKAYACSYINTAIEEVYDVRNRVKTKDIYIDSSGNEHAVYREVIETNSGSTTGTFTNVFDIGSYTKVMKFNVIIEDGDSLYANDSSISVIIDKSTHYIKQRHDDSYWNNRSLEIIIEFTID